ncbi:MAG: tyrosine-protein phosphatase [Treponema sp.]|nr:tyrosine-protein phosphatase [Treponema sp.]
MKIPRLARRRNFRDLGGIKSSDGRKIKHFMLIRGTTLRKLSPVVIELFKKMYKLHTIVDLRTKKEAEEKPSVIPSDVSYFHLPILDEALVGISHEKRVHSLLSLSMMPEMEELYVNMVRGKALDNTVEVLKFILTLPLESFSVIFHCSAGKDRTGLIAALLLSFLGVDRRDIIQDYLLTNLITKRKAKLIYFGVLISKHNHKIAKKLEHYYIAKQEYIEYALKDLEKQFGSLDNFFNERLKFSAQEKEEIKSKFLE